jgi:hypothetical protein
MKKYLAVAVIVAALLLTAGFFTTSHAQAPSKDDAPTFYRLTPGVYVNPWPRFTIHYPKDWIERPVNIAMGDVLRVSPPDPYPSSASLMVMVGPWPYPIDKWADFWVPTLKAMGLTDVTVVSDKPSQLRDGTPAREVEAKMLRSGVPVNQMSLATRKEDVQILTVVSSANGKIGDDLKAILYSVEFPPGKDEPVKLPPDVQAFLNDHTRDLLSHDIERVKANYSARYLLSGTRKGEVERYVRDFIGRVTSCEVVITEFVAGGDRAYLAGIISTNLGKMPLLETSIIKESGEWKWYGNQREVVPFK